MFEINKLLNLFDDEDVKKIILSSYFLSQEKNNELSNVVFEKLYILKVSHSEINVVINKNSNALSYYNYFDHTIYLNGVFNELTFFHELTHLFSREQFNFSVPVEYKNLKKHFLLSKNNYSLLFSFVEVCRKKKLEIIKNLRIDFDKKNILEKNNSEREVFTTDTLIELSIISELEDIVDAIVGGMSHDLGLCYEIDSSHNIQKTIETAGHGCKYYAIPGFELEEIIANYQSINLIDPDNELFNLFKSILGSDFISFLDNRCQQMNSNGINIENNNILK